MRRLLIRSGKDPFTALSAETTVAQDVLHGNVGNHLYTHAVHKTLMTPATDVVSNATLSEVSAATTEDCARVNEEFDAFVVPLANAFRPSFQVRMRKLTNFIKGLNIPVVVVGVGAQVDDLTGDEGTLDVIAPVVRDFVSAVLERSATIGVRGQFTQDYLKKLGFPEDAVTVIGCPSLFMHGPGFQLPQPPSSLDDHSRIAFNLTPKVEKISEILLRQADRYANLIYIPQDRPTLELMLWGEQTSLVSNREAPINTNHILYQQDRMRFFLDPWPWLDYLRKCDFAFGTRLHGNVAALLAETPAMLLAHDSRTLELAEYHGIPHRLVNDVPVDIDARDLLEQYDPAEFNRAYDDRFATYVNFLDSNGLAHIYSPGNENTAFDERVAATRFPPPVRTLCAPVEVELASRLRWLRDSRPYERSQHRQAYKLPFPVPAPQPDVTASQKAQVARLERRLARVVDRLGRSRASLAQQRKRADAQKERLDRQQGQLRRQEEQIQRLEERVREREARWMTSRLWRAARRVRSSVRGHAN